MYTELNSVALSMFSVAAAFGNVHGVYSPGNVKLTPSILASEVHQGEGGPRHTSPSPSSSTAAPAPPARTSARPSATVS